MLSGVAVDPRYCTARGPAYGYDVVVSITKPPVLENVAGTGSACAFDQLRRPLWLVLAWHSSTVGLHELSVERAVRENRAFVRHELLHGLGFVNSMFFCAYATGWPWHRPWHALTRVPLLLGGARRRARFARGA